MRRWTILSVCVVCLLLAGSVAYVSAQRRPVRVAREAVGRYQILAVLHGGDIRHYACDTRSGQVYYLLSRNTGAGQTQHTWETLGPAVSTQHPIVGRQSVGRYRIRTVVKDGDLRHFASDSRSGQLYYLLSRNVGLPQPEYTWEKLGPAISNQPRDGRA